MTRFLKIFIVAFALTFMIQVILDLPPVRQYIQAQADEARTEMFQLRMRYKKARMGV